MKKGIIRKILKWTLWAMLALLSALLIFMAVSRFVVWRETRMKGENSVDERIYVTLGGQEQYLSIRGEDVSNPVIIFLHGGPATPDLYAEHEWQCRLTDRYTFVSWEQRGAGRTYYENRKLDPTNETADKEQLLSDLDELVDHVRDRFGKDDVILMGHSWGTILGTNYASRHPEKVRMLVSVGQAVSYRAGEELSYREARRRALSRRMDVHDMDEAWWAWLADDGSIESLQNLRAATQPYLKARNAEAPIEAFLTGLTSPYMGLRDIGWILSQFDQDSFFGLNEQLFASIRDFDLRKEIGSVPVPVIFITGSDDWITPSALTSEFRGMLECPFSVMTLVDGAGHMVMFDDPESFTYTLDRAIGSVEELLSGSGTVPPIPAEYLPKI